MKTGIAIAILFFVVAGVSALFWNEGAKFGEIFVFQDGVVVSKDNSESGQKNNSAQSEQFADDQGSNVGQEEIIKDEKIEAPEILTPAPKIVSAPPVKLPEISPAQTAGDGALTRAGIIAQTNLQRQINLGGGHELKENVYLNIAAAAKAKDMLDNRYFEHVSPVNGDDVADFAAAAGYEYIAIGENLAKGNYKNDADLVQAWMASPGHRENILKSGYQEMGAAVLYGVFEGKKTWLAVQIFAAPKSACPMINEGLLAKIKSDEIILQDLLQSQEALAAEIDRQKEAARNLKNKNDLEILVARINQNVADYNAKLAEIKTFYANHKVQAETYNSQVLAHNSCLAALE